MTLLPLSSCDDASAAEAAPAVLLRGGNAGLEIVVDAAATVDAIGEALTARLSQSPSFFAGNDVCVRVDGRLPPGALARLEEVCTRFDLRIVEVGPPRRAVTAPPVEIEVDDADLIEEEAPGSPEAELSAEGSAPQPASGPAPAADLPPPAPAAPAPHASGGPRLVTGPLRSGTVIDTDGDLVVLGDVNPGAEVLARGNIIVLGRLRGIAHAAIGGERGFIFALRLEPQQIRIGTLVARAGDADSPAQGAEIACVTGRTIVVERYQGKVPV